jgi:hypothetical protein
LIDEYRLIKLQTEFTLLRLDKVTPRIIRAFALSGPKQDTSFTLPGIINRLKAETQEDLTNGFPVFEDGSRGLIFTHKSDLIDFLGWVSPTSGLFSNQVSDKLISPVINFARAGNYLPEYNLIEKIIDKTETLVGMTTGTTIDNFTDIQKTPQIKNLMSVFVPITPIEILLEDIIYEDSPQVKYQPLVILDITWDANSIPTLSGTVEPNAMVGVAFGDGTEESCDADSNGNWTITKSDPLTYEDTWYLYATTEEQNQYHTIKILVPLP